MSCAQTTFYEQTPLDDGDKIQSNIIAILESKGGSHCRCIIRAANSTALPLRKPLVLPVLPRLSYYCCHHCHKTLMNLLFTIYTIGFIIWLFVAYFIQKGLTVKNEEGLDLQKNRRLNVVDWLIIICSAFIWPGLLFGAIIGK